MDRNNILPNLDSLWFLYNAISKSFKKNILIKMEGEVKCFLKSKWNVNLCTLIFTWTQALKKTVEQTRCAAIIAKPKTWSCSTSCEQILVSVLYH